MKKLTSRLRHLLGRNDSYQTELDYLLTHGMTLGKNSTINPGQRDN